MECGRLGRHVKQQKRGPMVVWKFLAIACRIFGTLPYTSNSGGKIVTSKLWLLYSRVVLITTAIHHAYRMAMFFLLLMKGNVPKLLKSIHLVATIVSAFHLAGINTFIILKLQNGFPTVLNMQPWRKWELALAKTPCFGMCVLLVSWTSVMSKGSFDISSALTESSESKVTLVTTIISIFFNNMIALTVEMQFACGALVLKQQFLQLNKDLITMQGKCALFRPSLNCASTQRVRCKILHQNIDYDCGGRVVDWRARHCLLTTISENFNSLFSCAILSMTGFTFSHVLLYVYLIISDPSVVFTHAFMVITFVTKLYFIVHCCHSAVRESSKTAIYVHRLINNSLSDASSTEVEELRLFSQQLTHLEHLFEKSGYLKIDYDLLKKFVGLVSTYAITLMQFRLSNKEVGQET